MIIWQIGLAFKALLKSVHGFVSSESVFSQLYTVISQLYVDSYYCGENGQLVAELDPSRDFGSLLLSYADFWTNFG